MRLGDRFWLKVRKGAGCWEWTATRATNGYGRYTINRHAFQAHRLAWREAHGPIPPGYFVCHHCDVPACVRPDHLFLATQSELLDEKAALQAHLAALTAAIAPTHSMPRHHLPTEWQEHIRKIQQAALDGAGGTP